MKYTLEIELIPLPSEPDTADHFGGAKTMGGSLHEALCKAIHEMDQNAIGWLYVYTANINLIDGDSK